MHKRVVILAAVSGVAVLASTVPAAAVPQSVPAAPSSVAPAATPHERPQQPEARSVPTPAGSCTEVRKNLDKLARSGNTVALCTRRLATATKAKPAKPATGATATRASQAVPQGCTSAPRGSWWTTRTELCRVAPLWLDAVDLSSRRLIGTMSLLETIYSSTTTDSSTWHVQIDLDVLGMIGGGFEKATVEGGFSCTGACLVLGSDFPLQALRIGLPVSGEASFESTVLWPGDVGWADTSVSYTFTPAPMLPAVVSVSLPYSVRCDNAAADPESLPAFGCVFPNFWPTFYVSRGGPNRSFARHVSDAQSSGLPGSPASGRPLHRITNRSDIDKNGRTACPTGWERPEFFSCDEYPFRSTWQGARQELLAGYHGRTFDWCGISQLPQESGERGWSACWIPFSQNSSAGGLLASFYRQNRVITWDPFWVQVLP
jgi:hypothetical protein